MGKLLSVSKPTYKKSLDAAEADLSHFHIRGLEKDSREGVAAAHKGEALIRYLLTACPSPVYMHEKM